MALLIVSVTFCGETRNTDGGVLDLVHYFVRTNRELWNMEGQAAC